MTDNDTAAEKRIVAELSFGAKTAKRVAWETWEFTVAGPYQVEVTNASYGAEKADHRYVVTVDTLGDDIIPQECECPADKYNDDYDCKHKVALATVGGQPVLNAAIACDSPGTFSVSSVQAAPDGGTILGESEPDTCPNGNKRCDGPDGDGLPCFDCFEGGSQ